MYAVDQVANCCSVCEGGGALLDQDSRRIMEPSTLRELLEDLFWYWLLDLRLNS